MSGKVGDNVFRASGVVAAAAAGRTGTVDWVTTPKVTGDSPITAVTGEGYFLNTTAGQITINLPVGAAGSIVSVADYAGTWQTNMATVAANGTEKIGGVDGDVFLTTEGQSVTFVYVDSTQGWLNTMDSTSNVRAGEFIVASVSGCCNTLATAPCCADTKIATFTGPGTFCVSVAGATAAKNVVSYMVVAGGGAAQPPSNPLGGGGAGGFREYESPVTPYTSSPLDGSPSGAGSGTSVQVVNTAYPITVGAGGTPSPTGPGARGASSIFSTITSTGGGGGSGGSQSGGSPGGPGGSGGGGGSPVANCGGTGNTPPVTPAQGTPGGVSVAPSGSITRGGGGGGATVAGATGTASGNGGAGATTSISGSPTAYAGGGGAGAENYTAGTGGTGGGGNGTAYPCSPAATPGTANTGGGAGNGNGQVKNGGSGIVILRYQFQ